MLARGWLTMPHSARTRLVRRTPPTRYPESSHAATPRGYAGEPWSCMRRMPAIWTLG
jgi:hypothetical protein